MMYTVKRKGLRMQPWGTPLETEKWEERRPLYMTEIERSERKARKNDRR